VASGVLPGAVLRSQNGTSNLGPRVGGEIGSERAGGVVESPEHERRDIIGYWKSQTSDGAEVHRAEKIHVEILDHAQRYDVWDLDTTEGPWWVITNLTNLYPKTGESESMDHVLALHIGLMERLRSRNTGRSEGEERARTAPAWRRWEQAGDAFDAADEAEDFQAVGMRLRECLLTLVRSFANSDLLPTDVDRPRLGDFPAWADPVADQVSGGQERLATFLKRNARATWDLVNWLTHYRDAGPYETRLALEATAQLLGTTVSLLVRHEKGIPERCPDCASYRLHRDFRPEEFGWDDPYVTICEVCDWEEDRPAPASSAQA